MVDKRVVVVGAGPAGVRCAEVLAAAGLRPVLVDENQRDGGQIYRRQPDGFQRTYSELYGSEAQRAAALHRDFELLRPRIDYRPGALAWNVAARHLHLLQGTMSAHLPFDALLLCTGATDRLMPVEGWNLAGVYSLGGAQVALKSQACAIGRRVVFMGTGPLLYLVAAQYLKAGAEVAAVLDTSAWHRRLLALPQLLAQPSVLLQGMALTRDLRRGGVPVFSKITAQRIVGTAAGGVQRLLFHDRHGRQHTIDCDAIAMGYHLRPETQLAELAGCEFQFDAGQRQWLPHADVDGRSSVPGVYLAGDGARVLGARAAEVAGRLAALAALSDLGYPTSDRQQARLRRDARRLQRFAAGLRSAFPWPATAAASLSDDTVVCRCETISAGSLRAAARDAGAHEANRAKAFSRIGMGRCQGRYCGHAAAEILAHATQLPLEQVGRLRTQAPVKPIPIATVASES